MSNNATEEKRKVYPRRKYNDERERANACNRSLIVGISIYYIIVCIFAGIELSKGIQVGLEYLVIALSIIFIILDWGILIRDSGSKNFFAIVTYTYLLVYIITFVACENTFMQYSVYALLTIGILYYDIKRLLAFALITGIANIAQFVFLLNKLLEKNNAKALSELSVEDANGVMAAFFMLLIMLCLLYTVVRTADHGKRFNRDIVGTVTDEQEKEKDILDEVLAIASIIKENTTASNTIVQKLGDSAGLVNIAINQISASTQLTAENIQEQNIMTQSIQTSINDTVKRSRTMVTIANESSSSIGGSLEVMNRLKEQSEHIASTNKNLMDSMNRLQEKTRDVQDIAEIINSISDQTNLLSLNASIESAKAGEAGRGFAVVANQIRKLAEQTKNSTESIARILGELNNDADSASNTVNNTITATNYQGELISAASASFNIINQNVNVLAEDIDKIDKMLIDLAKANNTIVENISQISATTQEVTASSEEATAISEKNAQEAVTARKLLNEVLETSQRFDKYIER